MKTLFESTWGFAVTDLLGLRDLRQEPLSLRERTDLILLLGNLILDADRRDRFQDDFEDQLQGARFYCSEKLSPDQVEGILTGGLPGLSDLQLAQLLLNPVALEQLDQAFDRVFAGEPSRLDVLNTWQELIAQLGQQCRQAAGYVRPSLEELLSLPPAATEEPEPWETGSNAWTWLEEEEADALMASAKGSVPGDEEDHPQPASGVRGRVPVLDTAGNLLQTVPCVCRVPLSVTGDGELWLVLDVPELPPGCYELVVNCHGQPAGRMPCRGERLDFYAPLPVPGLPAGPLPLAAWAMRLIRVSEDA